MLVLLFGAYRDWKSLANTRPGAAGST